MKATLKYLLFYCLLLLTQTLSGKDGYNYGLGFQSYEVEKEKRTSLNLTPDQPFFFKDGFILEFDVNFQHIHHNFGYILRIIGQNNEHIDLLLSRTRNSEVFEPQLTATYKSTQVLNNGTFKDLGIEFDQWISIKLVIDKKQKIFKLKINEKEYDAIEGTFEGLERVNILFGKSNLLSYQTSDVPKMAVKNIRINTLQGKPLYYWELSKHTLQGAYDDLKKHFAHTENPVWLLDYHAYWVQRTSFKTGVYPQITFNPQINQVAIADRHSFYTYDITKDIFEANTFTRGFPSGSKANQLLYNPLEDYYFTYNFQDEIAVYNIDTKSWNNEKENPVDPHFWHHNRFFLLSPILYILLVDMVSICIGTISICMTLPLEPGKRGYIKASLPYCPVI